MHEAPSKVQTEMPIEEAEPPSPVQDRLPARQPRALRRLC